MRVAIPVSETKGLGVGPFSGTHNNVNPTLEVTDDGLEIGILSTASIPWSELGPVHLREGIPRNYLEVNGGGTRYALHFSGPAPMNELLDLLVEKKIAGAEAARSGQLGPGAEGRRTLRYLGIAAFVLLMVSAIGMLAMSFGCAGLGALLSG